MKQTTHINLGGSAFQIDEDAYQKLNNYLAFLQKKFSSEESTSEIMEDIENRINELFRKKCPSFFFVVNMDLVEEAITQLGRPEDFGDTNTDSTFQKSTSFEGSSQEPARRMYRDTSNRVFGGVCSGLGIYFNIDPVILRIIFVVSVFTGITPLVYVAFWIAMPKASSIEQLIDMKARKESYSSINPDYVSSPPFGAGLGDVISKIARGVAILVGIVFTIVGFVLLSSFILLILFFSLITARLIESGHLWAQLPEQILQLNELTFPSIALILVILIPLVVLFYFGISLLFNIRKSLGVVSLVLFLVWLGAILFLPFTLLKTFGKFAIKSTTKTEIAIDGNYSTYYIEPNLDETILPYNEDGFTINHLRISTGNDKLVIGGDVSGTIEKGKSAKIIVEKKASGNNMDEASEVAQNIEYSVIQTDSIIRLNRQFILKDKTPIRNQKVTLTLQFPDSVKVVVSPQIQSWLDENNKQ